MMPQVTAAALVSENKVLSHPASVDSITTSGNKEDFVSMGMTSANKLQRVVINTRNVLAIEALAAAQALDFRAPLETGKRAQLAQSRRFEPCLHQSRKTEYSPLTLSRWLQSSPRERSQPRCGKLAGCALYASPTDGGKM